MSASSGPVNVELIVIWIVNRPSLWKTYCSCLLWVLSHLSALLLVGSACFGLSTYHFCPTGAAFGSQAGCSAGSSSRIAAGGSSSGKSVTASAAVSFSGSPFFTISPNSVPRAVLSGGSPDRDAQKNPR